MNAILDQPNVAPSAADKKDEKSRLRDALQRLRSPEVVFGVVGYAGSGTSFSANQIKLLLEDELGDAPGTVNVVKARVLLERHLLALGQPVPAGSKIVNVAAYQTIGDDLRRESGEHGAVAAYAVQEIRDLRAANPTRACAYIIDSIKHPAEVELLRAVYGEAFCLVGVGCRPDVRSRRLERKYGLRPDADELTKFVDRDAEDSEHKYGQQVNATFHQSDYFVDNTSESGQAEQIYSLPDQIKNLFDILFSQALRRPTAHERGMYQAHAAAMQSSCLSRQVGASILDRSGNLLSVGSNEVPKFGGGSYDGSESDDDARCFKKNGYCSNSYEQDKILQSVLRQLRSGELLNQEATDDAVIGAIRKTRIKALIEFSRSVHAEMDAIISLARCGTKLEAGASLYTTTYPCHSCARHIVAAGIDTVVYLEPYSKSLAIDLHDDSIADNLPPDKAKGRVKFQPYQGVSPRLFRRVYLKSADLKDEMGKAIPPTGEKKPNSWLLTKAYTEVENDVAAFVEKLAVRP